MGSVRYTVIDGEIVSENRNGVIRDYVPDPLGSTVALLDGSQNQTDTMSYFPYGEVATRTGTNPTPFLFAGTLGYRQDDPTRTYVRARVYEPPKTRWLTEDPIGLLFDSINIYSYVGGSPVAATDPSGFAPCKCGCAGKRCKCKGCNYTSSCKPVFSNPIRKRITIPVTLPWGKGVISIPVPQSPKLLYCDCTFTLMHGEPNACVKTINPVVIVAPDKSIVNGHCPTSCWTES